MTTKLFVGNLPDTVRKGDLQALFEKFGQVVECDVVKDYGFVHYASGDEANAAAENLNGTDFNGSALRVEVSRSKVRPKPGMGGKGECYRCGREGHWSKDCPKGSSRPRRPPGDGYRGDPYREDPYDNYYRDPYYRPPPPDRYRPYADPYERRPPPPPREMYRERDPYARPLPEYYANRRAATRDPYYDYYERRSYGMPPAGRASPPRSRVPGPY
ncbi:hypothetical protein SNE40_010499 [Patella caerulea]|uniref:RNA-binding protein lark n=1 Tax=Patella caerulea TaxID=87958 RepID=A0AAN8JS10_PATCE